MVFGIAHELNNILYPILIYTDLLMSKAEAGTEEHADLSEILDCAHRAGDLMAKIRTYSRPNTEGFAAASFLQVTPFFSDK